MEEGTVVEELQRGYSFRSKILRASEVRVAKS
ncbi:MAG: nucleotide exchange factor GrpE [Hadesarchaea archaeon]|nr:MAG: nucleotide exchange factor GrpE [Hadesarchaea archaeon]